MTYLRFSAKSEPVLGKFGQCVISTFLKQKEVPEEIISTALEVEVHCDLAPQGLILGLEDSNSRQKSKTPSSSVLLRHAPFCPMLHLPSDYIFKQNYTGIAVAVAVMLESADSKVLITRRPSHMRTFPNVWVPPGGSSEGSETIIDTGLREVLEETGLDVRNDNIDLDQGAPEPLCLWESVYPPLLAKGDPKRHQMVVYIHVKLKKCADQLINEIKLCPQETDACAWLDLDQVKLATDYSTELNAEKNLIIYEPSKNRGDKVGHDAPLIETMKSQSILRSEVPMSGNVDVERISTGTRFALEQFYAKKKMIRNSKI